MKIAIIGGHMSPALAVMAALPKSVEIAYIGRKHAFEGDKGLSLEYQTITNMHIPFYPLSAGRIQRHLSLHTLPSLVKIPYGITQALLVLRKIKPDVVMSFGGYLSVAVCMAAKMLQIPIVVHEQTQEAGVANKFVGRFAKTICISFPSSEQYFPNEKVVLTGNPLLHYHPLASLDGLIPQGKLPLLLVVGGSAGSHAINVLIEEQLESLLSLFRIIHQTGDAQVFGDFARLAGQKERLSKELQKRYVITKFVSPQNIVTLYKKADMVIARSGVNTIIELLLLNKPAILIPLPSGQRHEQMKNALFLKHAGLAEVFPQEDITSQKLFAGIVGMMDTKKKYTNEKHKELVALHEKAAATIANILTHATIQTTS